MNINPEATKDGYEDLANAVIERAIEDYRAAKIKTLTAKRKKQRKEAQWVVDEVTHFFEGEHMKIFTSLDGDYILKNLERRFN